MPSSQNSARAEELKEEITSKVQAPQQREVWMFETLEADILIAQVTLIARDANGRKLGKFTIDAQHFFEPEDLAEWAAGFREKLEDQDTKEKFRSELHQQHQQSIRATVD